MHQKMVPMIARTIAGSGTGGRGAILVGGEGREGEDGKTGENSGEEKEEEAKETEAVEDVICSVEKMRSRTFVGDKRV